MANPEHLAILKKGVEAWNQWRKEINPIMPDLSEADLNKANLIKANLFVALLNRANLSEANLPGAYLFGANLSEADLSKANFTGADLSKANLTGANLSGANLSEADLSQAYLTGANLSRADLSKDNLSEADLSGANLSKAYLSKANFSGANLIEANLSGANLEGVDLTGADLSKANLSGADLVNAYISAANLAGANLEGADLRGANLSRAYLCEANLSNANLESAILIKTDFTGASLTKCKIYGISAWDINLKNAKQTGLIITPEEQPVITVDNIKVAQFIYLLLNNTEIRDVINTVANKAVLILGRFGERKVILDFIADDLRKKNYLPIMFDFDRPLDKNLTETVITLAGLCKFVIAVMSDPQSVPWEVAHIKQTFKIPIVPLYQECQRTFSMYDDEKINPWYLSPIPYKDINHIKQMMDTQILEPAEKKHLELRELKGKT
jgi:uncharacterized protein YjbI with pentapeptide repeats